MSQTRVKQLKAQIAGHQADYAKCCDQYLNGDMAAKTSAHYHASLRDNAQGELDVVHHGLNTAARLAGSPEAVARRAQSLQLVDEVAQLMTERERLAKGLDEAVAGLAAQMSAYLAACVETSSKARKATSGVTPPGTSDRTREEAYRPAAAAATHAPHWMTAAAQALQTIFADLRTPELLFSVRPEYQVRSGTEAVSFADSARVATRSVVEPLRQVVAKSIAAADQLIAESAP